MSILIRDGRGGGHLQGVDANHQALVNLPDNGNGAGFAAVTTEIDAGLVLGTRRTLPLKTSESNRLRVGVDSPLFNLTFEGSVPATAHLQQNVNSMTIAHAAGFLVLNNANSVSTSAAANVRTYRTFSLFGAYSLNVKLWLRETNESATQTVSEWGLGYASANASPTDGVFFRRMSGGQLQGVLNFNGNETTTGINTVNVPSGDGVGSHEATERNHYQIQIQPDRVLFWINDVLVAVLNTPSNQPGPSMSSSLPVFARIYNAGAASAGRRIEIGAITVDQLEMSNTKPWPNVIAGMGGGAYQTQPGSAVGQTANYVNNTAPVAATLSNTVASYTTLGGQYQFAATATNETDFALFGYANPAGIATVPGKTLHVTGLRIGEMVVTGVPTVNPTTFWWFAAAGSTNVSLVTTDAGNTVSPRRLALGAQSFLATAPLGTVAPGFHVPLITPLIVPPNTLLHIGFKQVNGAATAGLFWRGTVLVDGYFE